MTLADALVNDQTDELDALADEAIECMSKQANVFTAGLGLVKKPIVNGLKWVAKELIPGMAKAKTVAEVAKPLTTGKKVAAIAGGALSGGFGVSAVIDGAEDMGHNLSVANAPIATPLKPLTPIQGGPID